MPAPFSERMDVARRNYLEWQRQNTVFQEMGAFRTVSLDETRGDFSQRVSTSYVSASLFHLLGIQPQVGRVFARDEERPGRNRVAILTDRYFDRTFHRDRNTLGKSVTLDGRVYTIIGVLPASFEMPHTFFDNPQPDLIVPLPDSTLKAEDNPLQVVVVARLHRGVSLQQARIEMAGIAERLKSTDREFYETGGTSVFSFSVEATHPRLHQALYLLLAAATFLLLIACANLANLTLSRAALRSREIMVRVALGATRGRILTQLVSESLLVSLVGAAFGVMLAQWSLHLILAFKPPDIHQPELIVINLPVLLFAASAAVLTTCLFGLWPALAVSRVDISSRLKAGGGWGASAARLRGRQFFDRVRSSTGVDSANWCWADDSQPARTSLSGSRLRHHSPSYPRCSHFRETQSRFLFAGRACTSVDRTDTIRPGSRGCRCRELHAAALARSGGIPHSQPTGIGARLGSHCRSCKGKSWILSGNQTSVGRRALVDGCRLDFKREPQGGSNG